MKDITFITSNINKAKQVAKYSSFPISHKNIELVEIQSLDPKEVIIHKAKEAFKILKSPVIVEDVSVVIHAMGRLPGPFIKFFEIELGVEEICKIVNLYSDRSATIGIIFAFFDGKLLKTFPATIKGTVSDKPKGEGGFGFDPIFTPQGYAQTRAQMNEKNYDETSYRRIAFEKLQKFLTASLN